MVVLALARKTAAFDVAGRTARAQLRLCRRGHDAGHDFFWGGGKAAQDGRTGGLHRAG